MRTKSLEELRAGMAPEDLTASKARAQELMSEMVLAELRRHTGMTQAQLAEQLGIRQPSLSKLEGQADMQISTLRRLVEALGGELELAVRLPTGSVRLTQFEEPANSKA